MITEYYPSEASIVEVLMEIISKKELCFKWFYTITYYFKEENYQRVLEDCERIKYVLRSKYGSGARFFFFIEQHRDRERPNYLGYHIHFMVEDLLSEACVDDFTKQFRLQKDLPYLMRRCARGSDGVKVLPISEWDGGVAGLCGYLTKDTHDPIKWSPDVRFFSRYLAEVIDYEHSDIPKRLLDNLYDVRTLKAQTYSGRVFARQDQSFRFHSLK